jgi:predicted alpha/beta-hydrolase family hydrolase
MAGVALDKSEVSVKGIVILGGAQAPPGLPERLRTKTLEISR